MDELTSVDQPLLSVDLGGPGVQRVLRPARHRSGRCQRCPAPPQSPLSQACFDGPPRPQGPAALPFPGRARARAAYPHQGVHVLRVEQPEDRQPDLWCARAERTVQPDQRFVEDRVDAEQGDDVLVSRQRRRVENVSNAQVHPRLKPAGVLHHLRQHVDARAPQLRPARAELLKESTQRAADIQQGRGRIRIQEGAEQIDDRREVRLVEGPVGLAEAVEVDTAGAGGQLRSSHAAHLAGRLRRRSGRYSGPPCPAIPWR